MQIFEDSTGKGDSVIVLNKEEGRALLRALEFATSPRKALAEMKPLQRSSKAFKIAEKIEQQLAVY